jgi:hypothetical protein
MDGGEPRVRHRGFFLHSDVGEPDSGEHENPEGFAVRVRTNRSAVPRQAAGMGLSAGRSRTSARAENSRPAIRSGSVTGSRQRAHLPR